MPSARTILYAFIASPGDLERERETIHEVVSEFNKSWAESLSCQIELAGWEEATPGYIRPQERLNQDVDKCDLFIGMLGKRWGTPPDNDGKYSSGFEEEFERAKTRREQSGVSPEIFMLFKKGAFDKSKGDSIKDIRKIEHLRETLDKGKKIFYKDFSTTEDLKEVVNKCFIKYVTDLKDREASSSLEGTKTQDTQPSLDSVESVGSISGPSSLSNESFAFLKHVVSQIGHEKSEDGLSAFEVARLRLLANSISKPENQKMDLGVHDLNLLYFAHADGGELSNKEIWHLVKLGFQNLRNENVPLWRWYAVRQNSEYDLAFISSFNDANDNEKVGAIRVLRALECEFPGSENRLDREFFIKHWFSENSSSAVKLTALHYLAKMGKMDDYFVAKDEYERKDSGTVHLAFECMVTILLRTGQVGEAQRLVLRSQSESLSSQILKEVLEGFESLETAELLPGLEHTSNLVRIQAIKVLAERNSLDLAIAERLSEDNDASVRNESITVLSKFKELTLEEIKEILIRPRKQSPGLFGTPVWDIPDKEGEELFSEFHMVMLMKQSERTLTDQVDTSLTPDDAPYFARAERYFTKYAEQLRHDVDDTFGTYFGEQIERMQKKFGDVLPGKRVVVRAKDLEEFQRKKLTRQGLDILCRASKREDLKRIRHNLQGNYTEVSEADVEYMAKHGTWADIPILVDIASKATVPGFGGSLLAITSSQKFNDKVAKAVISMGSEYPISDLFSLEIPETILKRVISLCPQTRFKKISNNALFGLLDHESADVRKETSIKVVKVFASQKVESILGAYVKRGRNYYYNVIHWLDLGVSMPREIVRKVIKAATG